MSNHVPLTGRCVVTTDWTGNVGSPYLTDTSKPEGGSSRDSIRINPYASAGPLCPPEGGCSPVYPSLKMCNGRPFPPDFCCKKHVKPPATDARGCRVN